MHTPHKQRQTLHQNEEGPIHPCQPGLKEGPLLTCIVARGFIEPGTTPGKCLTWLSPPVLPVQGCFSSHSQILTLQRNKIKHLPFPPTIAPHRVLRFHITAAKSPSPPSHHTAWQLLSILSHSAAKTPDSKGLRWKCHSLALPRMPHRVLLRGTAEQDPAAPAAAKNTRELFPPAAPMLAHGLALTCKAPNDRAWLGQGTSSLLCSPHHRQALRHFLRSPHYN